MAEPIAGSAGSAPAANTTALESSNQAAANGSAPSSNAAPAANQTDANSANASGSDLEGVLGDKGKQEVISLRRRAQLAEQDAAYFRGLAEARQPAANQTAPARPSGPPDQTQFENWDDFLIAKAKWEIKQEQVQESAVTRQNTNRSRFQQDLAKEAEKDPEVMRSMRNAPAPSPAMTDAILESEASAAIAIHLAKNPSEFTRIMSLPSPIAQVREIGKLEAKLSTASGYPVPVNHISQAPEPLKPVGGGGESQPADLEKISMEEFASRRNAEQFSRKR